MAAGCEGGLGAVGGPVDKAAEGASGPAHGMSVAPRATKEYRVKGIGVYRALLVRYRELNKRVIQFDRDGSGAFDRGELKELILHAEDQLRKRNARTWNSDLVEQKDRREVWGMTMELIPTEAERDIIYAQCDVNEDGGINRAELLPALAMWAQLAHQRITSEHQACCT